MRIAIVGSGIAGVSFWLFLQKLELLETNEVTIYEARPAAGEPPADWQNAETYNASVIGAGIGIMANGLKVVERLGHGLLAEVERAGHALKTCKITNARGWTLANVPMGRNGEFTLMIGRDAFLQILKQRVPESAIVRKKVTRIDNADGLNVLVFSDGSRVEADLVVGADGIWSNVRRAIFNAPEGRGEYEYSPHYEGLAGVGGFVPLSLFADDPEGEMDVVFGANGFFGYSYTGVPTSSANPDAKQGVWWSTYSLETCPEDWRNINKNEAKRQLQARHRTWKNGTIQNIIRDIDIQNLLPTFVTPLLPTWERNGMVLIGDAAHAVQPSSGQGASMAMEDSEALALFLKHYLQAEVPNPHLKAVKQYCEHRMPRVGMVHKKAQEVGALKHDMGIMKEMAMYFFIWMINRFQIGYSYNTTIYDYDGPTEVQRKIESSQK